MAKADKSTKGKAPRKKALPKSASYLGWALTAAGAALFYASRSNQSLPGWVFFVGVGLAVIGLHLVFYATLPREDAISWFKSEAFALGLALTFRWAVAEPYRIPSGSMESTLHGDPRLLRGDRVWVNKWIYGLRVPFMNKRIFHGKMPARWDIVVFKAVEENAAHGTLVKRIVGLPGDRVEIRPTDEAQARPGAVRPDVLKGDLFINGERMDYPDSLPEHHFYTVPRHIAPASLEGRAMLYGIAPEDEFCVVPEGHYLMLGDNSDNSKDSRYYGYVPNEHILGRVASIFWPPTRWRDFTGFSQTLWWRVLVVLTLVWVLVRLLFGRSVALRPARDKGKEHLWVSFTAYGLRLPFTRSWITQWRRPRRGELVAYHAPKGEKLDRSILVGRVAGLPGETVQVKDGVLHINGAAVTEPACLAGERFAGEPEDASFGVAKGKGRAQVPEGHYFMLSEAPAEDALDSRSVGWIAPGRLVGRCVFAWWPPKSWRRP